MLSLLFWDSFKLLFFVIGEGIKSSLVDVLKDFWPSKFSVLLLLFDIIFDDSKLVFSNYLLYQYFLFYLLNNDNYNYFSPNFYELFK